MNAIRYPDPERFVSCGVAAHESASDVTGVPGSLIPTESVLEVVKGQRRTSTRKFYPGYMFVQMVMDDRTFHLVKNTPKITGFLGGTKPTPVPEREITGVQWRIASKESRS